jgi:hypothetical protein
MAGRGGGHGGQLGRAWGKGREAREEGEEGGREQERQRRGVLSPRPGRRQRHASLREIDGKHGDMHQCAWLEEEDGNFAKIPLDFGGFLNIKNSTEFALFCDPNLFPEIVKIFSGTFDIYLKVHKFLVFRFEHFENISK